MSRLRWQAEHSAVPLDDPDPRDRVRIRGRVVLMPRAWRRCAGHYRDGWKVAGTAAEKKRAVTLIVIDSSDGSISEFENVVGAVENGQPAGKALHDKWEQERAENQKRREAQMLDSAKVRADIEARNPAELFLLLSTMPACATREIVRYIAREIEPMPEWGRETTAHSPAVMLLRRLLGVELPAWLVIDTNLENDDEDDTAARAHLAALEAGTYSTAHRRRAAALAEALDLPSTVEGRDDSSVAEPEPLPVATTACTMRSKPLPHERCHYLECPQKHASVAA
ncbi:hypothetical protein [Elioraea sp.]|uniref:hypothetical protein n=1 Tax=Elioraea sp. TaxID=2185103 RepID=UPI0025C45BDF|nr:hypothetical protein [Elioraea sp.]